MNWSSSFDRAAASKRPRGCLGNNVFRPSGSAGPNLRDSRAPVKLKTGSGGGALRLISRCSQASSCFVPVRRAATSSPSSSTGGPSKINVDAIDAGIMVGTSGTLSTS